MLAYIPHRNVGGGPHLPTPLVTQSLATNGRLNHHNSGAWCRVWALPSSQEQLQNRLRVSAKGGLHLCLFGDGGHDLRPLLQKDSDKELLKETICELLDLKVAGHGLHQRNTGATPHFASIGG